MKGFQLKNKKKNVPYLKCVLRLSSVVHGRENGLHKNP